MMAATAYRGNRKTIHGCPGTDSQPSVSVVPFEHGYPFCTVTLAGIILIE